MTRKKHDARLVADEKSDEQKAREEDKDDVTIFAPDPQGHHDWNHSRQNKRLRLWPLHDDRDRVTLVNQDAHFLDFAWSDDGSQIAVLEVRDSNIESPNLHGTNLVVYDIATHEKRSICSFPRKLSSLQWTGDMIYAIGAVNTEHVTGDNAVWSVALTQKEQEWTKYAYGDSDSPSELGKAHQDITVSVQRGMSDEIRMLDGPTIFSKPKAIEAWDAAFTTDSDELIVAVAQGDVNNPPEVFTVTASGGAMVKLSNHAQILENRQFGRSEFLTCTSADGTVQLDAVWVTPASTTIDKPFPTVVIIHGGPYYRATDNPFTFSYLWTQLLLDAGFAVLLPNYRGNSGRGEGFAAHARGGVGTVDYDDIVSLVQYGIKLGYADPERLIVSGWSQGGFLTYLSCVRNGRHGHGWRFQAAIAGAGVSDWDTMTLTSDYGATFQSDLVGKSPWKSRKSDISNRRGSALWEFNDAVDEGGIIPPVLILHGEKDERVPLAQAVGFRRALQRAGLPFEMRVYPREGHDFKERRHIIDMGERVVQFVKAHIGKEDGEDRS